MVVGRKWGLVGLGYGRVGKLVKCGRLGVWVGLVFRRVFVAGFNVRKFCSLLLIRV